MNQKEKKPRILCAMSGGVDSSVAVALLVKAGHDVTGAFMVNYEDTSSSSEDGALSGASCWRGDYQDALRVSAKIGIPLIRFDFKREYKKFVLDYMHKEYKAGRTPNPDVLCNKFVKFGAWMKKAQEHGFDYLATGHYARLREVKSQTSRSRATGQKSKVKSIHLDIAFDDNKDQTYFLHQLNQAQLKKIIFPIGGYFKSEIREMAKKLNLPTAHKEESMGICFIGEVPMKKFLMKNIKSKKGAITSTKGEVMGEHDGLAFYTIGERIGVTVKSKTHRSRATGQMSKVKNMILLRNDFSKPLYVVRKNIKNNELVVGFENDPMLYSREAEVKNINWISGREPKFPLKCEVRLRHRQDLQQCNCEEVKGRRGNLIAKFTQPQRAVTPGQFAVFYLKGECLGGGEIK